MNSRRYFADGIRGSAQRRDPRPLGGLLEIIYGGEGSYFTSLRTKDGDTILNLEHGNASIQWGG